MDGDVYTRKSTSCYLITFVEEMCLGDLGCKKVLLCLPQGSSLLLLLNLEKSWYGWRDLGELGFSQERYVFYCDNQSVIHFGTNSKFYCLSKHIDMRYYWIWDVLDSKLPDH